MIALSNQQMFMPGLMVLPPKALLFQVATYIFLQILIFYFDAIFLQITILYQIIIRVKIVHFTKLSGTGYWVVEPCMHLIRTHFFSCRRGECESMHVVISSMKSIESFGAGKKTSD